MAQIPDNIASFLAVDFSGNVVNVEASLFITQNGVQQTSLSSVSTIQEQPSEPESGKQSTTVINNITQTNSEPFLIFAESFYIPLVNTDRTNFVNSVIYQNGLKIGINTKSPSFMLDVNGGSINIRNSTSINTYGFKIDGNSIAYSDITNNKIILGDATLLKNVDINTLILSGLINVTPTGITRYLTINDSGTVSAVEDVDAARIKVRGRNSTGSTLYKGTVVYMSGATGNRPNFSKAQANVEATSSRTFGIILDDIPNNTDGYALTIGYIDTLDTRTTATNPFTVDTLSAGDTIYLSPTNAGYVTNIKPSAPNHIVYIGKVTRTSPTNGTIVYQIQNGYELDEIHDVSITSKTNKDFVYYNSTSGLWKNAQFDSIMTIGGEVSGTYGNMTLVNDSVIGKLLNSSFSLISGSVTAGDSIQQAFGKVQNQINSLSGSLVYKGTWNATTNTPTLTSSVGTNGNFYIVNVAGTTTLNGISSWAVGDWVIFNGTVWQKISNQAVTQVNGYTGNVTLVTGDIAEGSGSSTTKLYFTNSRAQAAIFTGTASQFLKANGTTNEIVTDLDSSITGLRNSSNKIFTLSANFVSNSTRVFVNGVRMQAGASNDYVETGTNQITFTSAPDAGDIIIVDYIK